MSEQLQVVLIAVGWAVAVGAVGAAAGWALRSRSIGWVPPLVALLAVGAVLAGVVGTARAMFLSEHDFEVVLVVAAAAGTVAVLMAAGVGAVLVRSSRALQRDARRFGEVGEFAGAGRGPAEFVRLSEELTRTSDRLKQAREREVRMEESRRQLVSWVSHDLRTPLAGLRAMAEALEDGLAEDPTRYHRQMRAEVDRMVRMVDDLFELSTIHAGLVPRDVQEVVLGDLVSEALAAAEPVARAGGVRLAGEVDEGLLVRVDPAGLSRVLGNLLVNAVRHTPADGTVHVSGRALPDAVEVAVSDACGGIAEPDLERVFDLAWRGESARTPGAHSGAGLGLAIVKGIVEAHRGEVRVDNVGTGCRFLVRLPG